MLGIKALGSLESRGRVKVSTRLECLELNFIIVFNSLLFFLDLVDVEDQYASVNYRADLEEKAEEEHAEDTSNRVRAAASLNFDDGLS